MVLGEWVEISLYGLVSMLCLDHGSYQIPGCPSGVMRGSGKAAVRVNHPVGHVQMSRLALPCKKKWKVRTVCLSLA